MHATFPCHALSTYARCFTARWTERISNGLAAAGVGVAPKGGSKGIGFCAGESCGRKAAARARRTALIVGEGERATLSTITLPVNREYAASYLAAGFAPGALKFGLGFGSAAAT